MSLRCFFWLRISGHTTRFPHLLLHNPMHEIETFSDVLHSFGGLGTLGLDFKGA